MPRTKTMLLTVVAVALAVPSLWAQKERLVRPKAAPDGSAVCVAAPIGIPPTGYYANTNKCSSGNANYGLDNSKQNFVHRCSDSGGVEATYDGPLNVDAVGRGNTWPIWANPSTFGSSENYQVNVYRTAINIANEIGLTLKHKQGVFGLEVDNLSVQTYTVTFHTDAGDVSVGATSVGGTTPDSDPFAQRFVAICSGPAITGVLVHCDSCSDNNGDGDTAIGQIRGDLFKGF